ncbi:MAG: chorismate synthase [Solobacterium sp.]|nr:chorismate synthase [Solobacterium sp.]
MSGNTLGKNLTVTIFGESHGPAVGAVIDGLPSGLKIDMDFLLDQMKKRKASGKISTARQEADLPEFVSGLKDGYTEGTPLTLIIRNENVRRDDYAATMNKPRPSHADYSGHIRYGGFEDASGGGHFSARLTAPLTAAGAIAMQMLKEKGILIGTHIRKLHHIEERPFSEEHLKEDIELVNSRLFAVLEAASEEKMKALIEEAAAKKDSVGGILETAVYGLEAGIGEPMFDTLEGVLAKALFAVPAVKGVQFGSGFAFADMYGSQANDPFAVKDGAVQTLSNHNGGINGGISNGMPIRFETVIKPTPSIGRKQATVDLETMTNTEIEIRGRHDPAVIHRARAVIDAVTALAVADLLMEKYGRAGFEEGHI